MDNVDSDFMSKKHFNFYKKVTIIEAFLFLIVSILVF